MEPKLVGDIAGDFYVPAFQRGYRWGVPEVTHLLADIHESEGAPYYLQPVVVKAAPEGKWELVDGQQRLTTLFLILKYMQDEGLQSLGPTFSLEYETRRSSQDYLRNPEEARSQENIDFFHIYEAYRCIDKWFERHEHRKQNVANKFYGYLFDSVRVIWYQAPEELDSVTLFTRLNIGRIPLTDAELIKALLLSRAGDRSQEIAAQWDSFERDLRVEETWAFAAGTARSTPTRISLLLDTLADLRSDGLTGRDRPLFHTFETLRSGIVESPFEVWNDVVDLHGLVLGWYSKRDLFHKIGYLTLRGRPIRELVVLSQGKTKSSFEGVLDEQIRADLSLTKAGVRELSYTNGKTSRVLLLMNVETVRRMDSSERSSFSAYASGLWSLEHIHAQNAEQLNRADQWVEWLRLHREALAELPHVATEVRAALTERINTALADISEDAFRPLERELTQLFTPPDAGELEMDTIANLALLRGGDNSALSNSVFEVKRREILNRDRQGSYIPVCTRNVFLKYYTDPDAQQIYYWGREDRAAYLDDLVATIGDYLLPEEDEGL